MRQSAFIVAEAGSSRRFLTVADEKSTSAAAQEVSEGEAEAENSHRLCANDPFAHPRHSPVCHDNLSINFHVCPHSVHRRHPELPRAVDLRMKA